MRQVISLPHFCRKSWTICVTLSHRGINLLTPDISFSRHCFIPKGVAASSPFQPTFCFMLSLETCCQVHFLIRSPCPSMQGGSSGQQICKRGKGGVRGAKSVSHDISSKRSCVTMQSTGTGITSLLVLRGKFSSVRGFRTISPSKGRPCP